MVYDYTWIGGDNNQASNPNCWSPTGLPQAGSTLDMTGGTMNVDGYTLPAGDGSLMYLAKVKLI